MTRHAADTLCMECGLCCDGTLFGSVRIDPGERERLTRIHLRVVDQNGELSMPQRCTALVGCLCSLYADRPRACAQYECSLRKSVLAGAKTEAGGRADIARMRALQRAIGDAFSVPASLDLSVWDTLLALEEPTEFPDDEKATRRQDAGLDALSELLALGRSAFEPSFSGGS